jgi:hypothetical protein
MGTGKHFCGSGSLSRIPDPNFYPSQIPDPTTATTGGGGGEFVVLKNFFYPTNFRKLKFIIFLNRLRKKVEPIYKEL